MDAEHSPIVATIAGVEVVTIPLADYAALVECRRRLEAIDATTAAAVRRFAVPPRSPVEADREVADFLMERFGLTPMDAIRAECLERFGRDRTPSRTAAYEFWQRLRRRAEAAPRQPK